MRQTQHAKLRSQQRAISQSLIDLILRYGTPERKPGDANVFTIHRKSAAAIVSHLKQLIHKFERARGKGVLVGMNGDIITVYHLR